MRKKKDITGKIFGRLTVCSKDLTSDKSRWECLCSCGNITIVSLGNLGRATNSCGCLRKEVTKNRAIKPLKETIINQIWIWYKRNARYRKIEWMLNKEQFSELIFKPCYYCGNKGTLTKTSWSIRTLEDRSLKTNGIDRLDNLIGYYYENCVTSCSSCNYAKGSQTISEFFDWIKRLITYQDKK